jgi:iron complex outermembrane receptor protein
MPGAHIAIENTKFGGISDYDGRFLIREIPPGEYRVTISYIGYESQNLQVSLTLQEQEELKIKLIPKPYLAEPAIITANRTEVARNLTPLTVSQVSRKTLEESGESNLLPVVARNVPGVFLTERGMTGFGVADGAAGQISIRGIGGSPNTQVLVMVDGHPQYMGIFGHPLPDAYVSSDAEKVEVIRGPASVLYGSNAMAGVINIITRQQNQDGFSLMANAGYGSFNTMKLNGSAGYRNKKFQAYVSYNHDQTDGHRDNSDFNLDNGYLKLSYDLNSHFRIWTDASLSWSSSTNPGPVDTEDTTYVNPTHYQDIFRGFASIALENKYEKSSGTAKFYYNWGQHDLWDGFVSTDKNMGLMVYQSFELFEGNTFTVGYDFAGYGGVAENTIPEVPVQFVDTSVYETGVYLLAQQRFIGRLNLTAGIRYQYHELFGSEWVPQAGATFDISENSTVKANVSKGYRSPSIRELFIFKPANPDLDPENVWNYEAGMTQKFLKQRLSFDLTGFFASGSNLIEVQGVFPDVQYRNTGEFEHFGLEFQGKYLIADGLDATASYSWLHTDKPVLAAPEHMVYAEGNYRVKGFAIRLSGQYINQLITRTDPQAEESYFNLSARVGYTYKNFLTLYLEGNNLLDEEYEINYGYPMPGINFFGGITVKWVGRK